MKRVPRAAGVLGWALGATALHAAVPFQLSRLGGRAGRPGRSTPAARHAGVVTVAAGAALMAWALAAHSAAAPQGWELESGLTPGYLLRAGPYWLSRNPMYSGEAVAWAGLASLCAAFAVIVRWEERQLLDRFGEDYRAYLAEVPRWLPGAPWRRRARLLLPPGPLPAVRPS